MDDYEQNASFLRSLDLDPLSILGAPPAVPDPNTHESEPIDVEPAGSCRLVDT